LVIVFSSLLKFRFRYLLQALAIYCLVVEKGLRKAIIADAD